MPSTNALAQFSDNLVYSAMAVYALAMLVYAGVLARRATAAPVASPLVTAHGSVLEEERTDRVGESVERFNRIAAALTILAFTLHLGGALTRGFAAGRAPWGNMYEFALVGALAATAAFLVFLRRQPVADLGVWIVAIVLLTLGLAVTVLYTPAGALVPVLDSYWLIVHVAAAITAGGVFTLGAVTTVVYLARERRERRAPVRGPSRYLQHLPNAETLNRVAHAAHLFAFPVWTFAVIAGAIWAENSWGRYWGWDPKETWAFITWVLYAAYLHAEATAGWRGRRAAWFAIAGYVAFLFNFFGVNMWITGLHSYAGI